MFHYSSGTLYRRQLITAGGIFIPSLKNCEQ